jgi:hypothetical protein
MPFIALRAEALASQGQPGRAGQAPGRPNSGGMGARGSSVRCGQWTRRHGAAVQSHRGRQCPAVAHQQSVTPPAPVPRVAMGTPTAARCRDHG